MLVMTKDGTIHYTGSSTGWVTLCGRTIKIKLYGIADCVVDCGMCIRIRERVRAKVKEWQV